MLVFIFHLLVRSNFSVGNKSLLMSLNLERKPENLFNLVKKKNVQANGMSLPSIPPTACKAFSDCEDLVTRQEACRCSLQSGSVLALNLSDLRGPPDL